jgi:hypothetical protein
MAWQIAFGDLGHFQGSAIALAHFMNALLLSQEMVDGNVDCKAIYDRYSVE